LIGFAALGWIMQQTWFYTGLASRPNLGLGEAIVERCDRTFALYDGGPFVEFFDLPHLKRQVQNARV
jgi:hypothetical protein